MELPGTLLVAGVPSAGPVTFNIVVWCVCWASELSCDSPVVAPPSLPVLKIDPGGTLGASLEVSSSGSAIVTMKTSIGRHVVGR